jgi:hypothetical protein
MAVKFYAEIVRETPAAKNVCGSQVYYAVRVFKADVSDPTTEVQLDSFHVIEAGTSSQRRAVVTTKDVKDLSEGKVIVTTDDFWKPLDKDYFRIGYTSTKPGVYTPQFKIQVYEPYQAILPGLSNASTSTLVASTEQADKNDGAAPVTIVVPRQNTSKNWGQTGYNPTKWQTVTIPTITFTKAAVVPDRPDAIAASSADTIDGWTWDECTGKRWVAVFASYRYVLTKSPYTAQTTAATVSSPNVDGKYSKQIKYTVQALSAADLKSYPSATFEQHRAAGRVRTIWTASGWDWADSGKAFVDPKNTKPTISTQSYKTEAIVTRKNFSVAICNGTTPPTGGNNPGNNVTPTPESVKQASNFNPYPHVSTRHFPPSIWRDSEAGAGLNIYDSLATFYIDPDTVDISSGKAANKDKYSKAAALNRFWGFRFLFNPQYLSYSMTANNQVDWTRPNENGAVLVAAGIGGNITVNILLDRVADMNTLRMWDKGGRGILNRGPYPVDMTPEQCAGILNRGTEYDLEYLFRVLNGNPQETTLLGNPTKDLEMLSANMGYIAQIPFVFKIQDHMRYKVILSSLSIEHSLFTREMIPLRTVVQIQLERLPDIPSKGSKYREADKLTSIVPILNAQAAAKATPYVFRDR